MESRNHFILQVKDKITSEHGKDEDSSFIFGLSGKWGEGKTTFLKGLQKKLERSGFKIVWINPWKFGDDKISFLRNFLKEISAISKKSAWDRIRDVINNKDDLRDLYYDTNHTNIHWGLFLILFLLTTACIISYWFLLPQINQFIPGFSDELKIRLGLVGAILVVPFLIPLVGSILTRQTSSKSISTIDEFDKLLSKYLSNLDGKKVAVFIDDLDRVTPEVARNALDNMRVFFDKSEITFVVTGDHTVLERYIGTQTLPNGSDAEKLEEGRRYLKKVFNLYWRLPVPIDSEFDAFLQQLVTENKKELDEIFKNKADQETFSKYLKLYFDKNFRHVIRFFDTVLFTFKIIKNQHETAEGDSKKYFDQMLSKPLLVVRILMIQELCMTLFEGILQDTGILRLLEDYVERKDSGAVDKTLEKYTLTPNQSVFIRKFLYEEPRFFKNKVLEVYAFEPFLYLAADASFGDARGLSKEDFIVELKTGDPDRVANSVQNCGEEKIKQAASAVSELLSTTTEGVEKSGYIRTLSLALAKISDHFSQPYFLDAVKDQDYSQVFSGSIVSNRMEISQEFWRWLDTQDQEKTKSIADKFPLVGTADFDQIALTQDLGHFSSRVVSRWLRGYYASDRILILSKMETIFPRTDKKILSEEFETQLDQLVSDLFGWADSDQKERLYKVMMEFLPGSRAKLKELVFTRIKGKDEATWQWSFPKTTDTYKSWTQEELEKIVTDLLQEATTSDDLASTIRYANGKVVKTADHAWGEIKSKKLDMMKDIIQQLSNESLGSFTPPSMVAKALFDIAIKEIETGDESTQAITLPTLQKKAFWENIKEMPHETKIKNLLGSPNPDVVREVKLVLHTWGKDEEEQTNSDENS